MFYDVPTLRLALAEKDAPMQVRGEKPPSRIIDFDALSDPEGALLLIDATTAPYVHKYQSVQKFLDPLSGNSRHRHCHDDGRRQFADTLYRRKQAACHRLGVRAEAQGWKARPRGESPFRTQQIRIKTGAPASCVNITCRSRERNGCFVQGNPGLPGSLRALRANPFSRC
jgi:hypothetical protein